MPPADGGSAKDPKRRRSRRSSSIRAAAETAATSTPPARRPAAGSARPSRPTKRRPAGGSGRRSRPAPKPVTPTPTELDEVGIVDVTGARGIPPTIPEPEIPDLPPPEGVGAEAGGPSFPDYESHSDTWDPFDDDGAEGGRLDPDFDAQRTLGQWLEGVIPPDAQVHFIRAGSEFAKGVQVTVDHHAGRRRDTRPEDAGGPNRIEIE